MNFLASSTRGAQVFALTTLIGSIIGFYMFGISISALALMLLGYFLYGCLGIVVTFHRLHTHKAYTVNPVLSKIFSLLGCFAGTGSPLAWVAIHINHHLKSDKPGDPHSPLYKGFKIFGLNYADDVDAATKWRMRGLITDKFQQFLHRYYFGLIALWSLFLFSVGGFYLMIFLHWAPAFVTAIMSNVVNYVGHKPSWIGSYRTYNLNDQSVNNWLWAIPSWGEALHNNHHRYPTKLTYSEKWYEIDISGWIIRLIRRAPSN